MIGVVGNFLFLKVVTLLLGAMSPEEPLAKVDWLKSSITAGAGLIRIVRSDENSKMNMKEKLSWKN